MNSIRKKIIALLENHQAEFVSALLDHPFWLQTVHPMIPYKRFEDDSTHGNITVTFGPDGDGWIEVMSKPDPDEFLGTAFRFRTDGGGGRSQRVKNALFILAEAIRQDNEKNPQHRPPREEA